MKLFKSTWNNEIELPEILLLFYNNVKLSSELCTS